MQQQMPDFLGSKFGMRTSNFPSSMSECMIFSERAPRSKLLPREHLGVEPATPYSFPCTEAFVPAPPVLKKSRVTAYLSDNHHAKSRTLFSSVNHYLVRGHAPPPTRIPSLRKLDVV
jgi:hypothetical protein